jgi:hypothetical protein
MPPKSEECRRPNQERSVLSGEVTPNLSAGHIVHVDISGMPHLVHVAASPNANAPLDDDVVHVALLPNVRRIAIAYSSDGAKLVETSGMYGYSCSLRTHSLTCVVL